MDVPENGIVAALQLLSSLTRSKPLPFCFSSVLFH